MSMASGGQFVKRDKIHLDKNAKGESFSTLIPPRDVFDADRGLRGLSAYLREQINSALLLLELLQVPFHKIRLISRMRRLLVSRMLLISQMYEQQLKDAKDWYNEFESPMALRRQWQAAGFSPMAALNGGNTGSGMQSVGSADAASYEYQSPLSGVGGNMMQAVAAANNYLSTQVQREKSLAEIEAQKIQNQRDQIALGYERDNYVKDKLDSRLSLSKGFDHGAAASMDNYIANGPYERAFKLYDSYMSQRKSAELRLENARAKNTTTDTEPLLNRASIGLTNSQRATLDKMRPIQYLNEKNKYSLGQLDISNYSNNHARDFGLSSGSNNLVDYFIKLLGIKWETDPLADNEIYYDDVYNNLNIPKDKAFFRHYLKVPKLSPVDVENYDYVEEDEKIYSDELAEFHCDNGFLNYDDVQKFFKRVRQQLKYYYGIDYRGGDVLAGSRVDNDVTIGAGELTRHSKSHNVKGSARLGQLMPVDIMQVLPNENFRVLDRLLAYQLIVSKYYRVDDYSFDYFNDAENLGEELVNMDYDINTSTKGSTATDSNPNRLLHVNLDMDTIRYVNAATKLAEKMKLVGSDYGEQLLAEFGIKPSYAIWINLFILVVLRLLHELIR
ncbi:unnamed protein product [Cylicocyclus nassatus]|uniref:Uncharacterized protein n=1 Tax=Cylicocyclus nassatus TaxID=53992 RepID=A0AA36GQL5_CYLNA|nr:unnamed protein product [Cylicocyclus nassatus]